MADVAVAILNYNGATHLERFLPSIIKYSTGARIIVGDNGSKDNSLTLLKSTFPEVKVIELPENYGYAGGYNRLIAQIDCEYIILANSDIEVTPNWIPPLVDVLEKDPAVAAVQPKILSCENRSYFEYAGAAGGYMDKYGYPFCRGRIFSRLEEDLGQYDNEVDVFWTSGACFILRKSAFQQAGGFDARFFAHMEEIDLNWRFLQLGYTNKYTAKSKVYHLGGGTLSYDNPRKTYLNFRNSWIMLIKNLHEYNRLAVFSRRYLFDLLSIILFLGQFRVLSALAVIKAHFYIITHANSHRKGLPGTNSKARNSYKMRPEKFSIVWQYFVRNKKKYSDL